MPRRNQPTLSQDLKTGIGTLSNLDVEEGKADVTIPSSGYVYYGVPIFYHCAPDDIENGPKAFFNGASALIADIENASNRRIIGFADGFPRPCMEPGAHYILQVLTHTSKPGPPIEYYPKGYLVGIDEETCDFELLESERLLQPFVGSAYLTIANLSQCKYCSDVAGSEFEDECVGIGDGSTLNPVLATLLHPPVCKDSDKLPVVTTLDSSENLMTVDISDEGVCSGDCTAGYLDMDTGIWTTVISWISAPKSGQDILITYYERDVREASLYHFDNFWISGGFDRILKIVNHGGSADFEFRLPVTVPPGGEFNLIGALSPNLDELYIGLYASILYCPPVERQIEYFVFKLTKGEFHEYIFPSGGLLIKSEWELIKTGNTPAGMEYIDNIVTRDGKCGCWKSETETLEEYTIEETLEQTDCWGSGGSSYMAGKRFRKFFKTFSLQTESFIDSNKMEAFHMSPDVKDYAICEAIDAFSYDDNGLPLSMVEWDCVCGCNSCGPPSYTSSVFDRQIVNEIISTGWSEQYRLFTGLKTKATKWGKFWQGVYHLYTNHYHMAQACPPAPGRPTGWATSEWFNSQGYQYLTHGYTTFVCRYINDSEHIQIAKGNCGHDGSSQGWMPGGACQIVYPPWLCKHGSEAMYNCSDSVYINPDNWTTVIENRILSPFEMILHYDAVYGWDSIGSTFVSYDEKTGALIRGIQYQPAGQNFRWKILAKFPGCVERDITNELQSLLSPEEFNKFEAIICVDKVV